MDEVAKPTFNAIDEVKLALERRMNAGIEEIMIELTHRIGFDHSNTAHTVALCAAHEQLKAFFISQIDVEELARKYQDMPLHERI